MSTGVVVFTRDLRVHDNPTLWQALHDHDRIVPLFVLDEAILRGSFNRPNRATFLAESLADLDRALHDRGARLVVRRGQLVDEVRKVVDEVRADAVHISVDASGYAQRRLQRLRAELDVEVAAHPETLFVVPPGDIVPSGGGDHMAVFGAYFRRWSAAEHRPLHQAPSTIEAPDLEPGSLPGGADICAGDRSPELAPGGETAGRARLGAYTRGAAPDYADLHDLMAVDGTSRLSPYLHFGCLSPREVIGREAVAADFVRQVCWRDFHAQVLAARPASSTRDYRPRSDRWRRSTREFEAWRTGRTGLPLVDAGMRQLLAEGWMHNRARLVVGHFLVKTLYLDWRLGAAHFTDWLLDGDVANNSMNWQWVAGTGTDSRFNRTYNVDTQAARYDPDGEYVRRYVPELRSIEGGAVHRPWTLPRKARDGLDYPDPIVDVAEGNRRFLTARGK